LGTQSLCKKLIEPQDDNTEAIQAQALTGAAMAGATIASSINMSSPNGMWQSVNIMQLFVLILLLGIYLPQRIKDILTSNSFLSSSIKLPFIENLYGIKNMLNFFDFSQENSHLMAIGIESGSTFNNIFTQILLLIVVM
jgi:hypothetical protein